MVELKNPTNNIRGLASAQRQIPIEVDGSGSYEIVLTIWTVFTQDNIANLDLGADWAESVATATPADLVTEIEALGGPHCSIWLSLLGLISSAPHPHDPTSAFEWIGKLNPQRLQRWILGYIGEQSAMKGGDCPTPSMIEEAAEGDLEAVKKVIGDKFSEDERGHLISLLGSNSEAFRDRVANTLLRFQAEVYTRHEEEFSNAIARAAAARRAVANRDDAETVIEQVTNGLDFEIPRGVTRVVLVPSVVLRPLSLIDQHRGVLMVFYAMADEFINNNPDAPPSWLVRTYKALSDEKRLRILRRLSEGETSLDELTELLDISKSTVHHHISVLRGAGLIRVQISHGDSGKESHCYGLRDQAFGDASAFLENYIRPQGEAALA